MFGAQWSASARTLLTQADKAKSTVRLLAMPLLTISLRGVPTLSLQDVKEVLEAALDYECDQDGAAEYMLPPGRFSLKKECGSETSSQTAPPSPPFLTPRICQGACDKIRR